MQFFFVILKLEGKDHILYSTAQCQIGFEISIFIEGVNNESYCPYKEFTTFILMMGLCPNLKQNIHICGSHCLWNDKQMNFSHLKQTKPNRSISGLVWDKTFGEQISYLCI